MKSHLSGGGILLALLATTSTSASTSTPQLQPLHSLSSSSHTSLFSDHLACHPSSKTINILSFPKDPSQILIDTTSHPPSPFHPWSFAPFCFDSPSIHLCIYTSTTFSNNRGISIFTTPAIASQFASQFLHPTLNLTGINNNPPHPKDPTYLSPIPGKGTGTLASHPLSRGTLITAYTPLLLSYREDILSTTEREVFLRRGVDQLPRKSREMYYGLAKIYHVESVKAQDVLKANTFGVEVGGWEHLGIWPETARINHSCGPNSQYRIDSSSLVHSVHAARPIAKDEEITLTYINPFNPTNLRQTSLSSSFHFTCTCPRCHPSHSSDSDSLLHRIKSLEAHLSDWNARSPATIADAERLIEIYKGEGLDGFLDVPYGHAALMCSAYGEREGVVRYARLAREAVGLKDGVGVGDWGLWDRLVGGPEGHWSWGRRGEGMGKKRKS